MSRSTGAGSGSGVGAGAPGGPAGGVAAGSLAGLLASREIVIACGPGGVGKTTVAASAAATAAARTEGKVLVVTVDPARRLAAALGITGIGNSVARVPAEAFRAAGVEPRGELWAAMLDTKESWDGLIRRHAPDADTAERILGNPLYRSISGRFAQSHDYIAMERLYELHAEGSFDLIVVDTPPSRNALDFIDAPERMVEFFSSRLLRWLIAPARSRVLNAASRPFYQIADRILGAQFLADIAEFFILFQSMSDGFAERARSVEHLVRDRRTAFVVVTTLEFAPAQEAGHLVRALGERGYPLGALVLNRVLPEYVGDPASGRLAEKLISRAGGLAPHLAELVGGEPEQVARVLGEVGHNFRNLSVVAHREAAVREQLSTLPEVVATIPEHEADISDMTGLLRLGERIW